MARSITRRRAIVQLFAAAAATPIGMQALAHFEGAPALAQEAPGQAGTVPPDPPGQTGHSFFSLEGPGEQGPLSTGKTRNPYGHEIGSSSFQGGAFVMHLPYPPGLTQDWIRSRIGNFSIGDGALMVDALGELNSIGCFALEMRRQADNDRKHIRANWLSIDPPTGMVAIGTDGLRGQMDLVAMATSVAAVRPQGEWNRILFLAQGQHFEGWVNGEKAIEGDDDHFGSGQVSLIAMRMNKAAFQVRFRNLHVWATPPDPTTVWG